MHVYVVVFIGGSLISDLDVYVLGLNMNPPQAIKYPSISQPSPAPPIPFFHTLSFAPFGIDLHRSGFACLYPELAFLAQVGLSLP